MSPLTKSVGIFAAGTIFGSAFVIYKGLLFVVNSPTCTDILADVITNKITDWLYEDVTTPRRRRGVPVNYNAPYTVVGETQPPR